MASGVLVAATDYSACTELLWRRGELITILTTVAAGTNLIEQVVIHEDNFAGSIEKIYRNLDIAKECSVAGRVFAETLAWNSIVQQGGGVD